MTISNEARGKGFIATILGLFAINAAAAKVPAVTPAEAAALVANGKAVLVDVREPSEWARTGVAAPALLLSTSDFRGPRKGWKPFLDSVGDRQVILYCLSGSRSRMVAAALEKEGVNVANLGRFASWKAAGLPTRSSNQPPKKG